MDNLQAIQIYHHLFFHLSWYIGNLIKNWWWFIIPFILWKFFVKTYLYWLSEKWYKGIRSVTLEVKLPPDVLKPFKAMEQVLTGIWAPLYDPPNWKEKWIEGKGLLSISLDIVSIDTQPHFYIRLPNFLRSVVEGAVYGQFPDAELIPVDDYTKIVPPTIPNKEWDLFGADFIFIAPDFLPIRTLSKFFEEKPEAVKEEKRLDPLAGLLEAMATKTQKGEHIWIQIILTPVTDQETKFFTKAKEFIDKLIKRPGKPKSKSIPRKVYEGIVYGKQPVVEVPAETRAAMPEMELTPGEKEILKAVEEKISKPIFRATLRSIYIAKRDVYFHRAQLRIPYGFFSQFNTANLNAFKPLGKTITKVVYFMIKRRTYLRKRAMFRKYLARVNPLFPYPGGSVILNTEEVASLYHFPPKAAAPGPYVPRVKAKKREIPPEVATE